MMITLFQALRRIITLVGSHLMGTFYRTIRLVENGIKPIYVFDGKPPQMKSGELSKRAERREEAQKALEKAEEAGKCIYFVCF
jgi:flap endonuclease-1